MPTAACLPRACWRASRCRCCTQQSCRMLRRSTWRRCTCCRACGTSALAGISTALVRGVAGVPKPQLFKPAGRKRIEPLKWLALLAATACKHPLLPATLSSLHPAPAAVSAGPAAELLVAQLAGLPLHRLHLAGYRMLPGVLGSVAEALPALCQLVLGLELVEGSGRLELGALPRLLGLRGLEIRLLPGRASAPDVTVAPLPAEASRLSRLTSLAMLHVRPGQGQEDALWGSLAHLPVLRMLRYEQSGHAVRQPPAQLLRLATLTSLHIKVGWAAGELLDLPIPPSCRQLSGMHLTRIPSPARLFHRTLHPVSSPEQIDGVVYSGDPPGSIWTQFPELPEGALPSLECLQLDCVGLLGLPASWCR